MTTYHPGPQQGFPYPQPVAPAPKPIRWFQRKRVLLPATFLLGLMIGSSMGGGETTAAASTTAPAATSAQPTAPVQAPIATQAPAPEPTGPMTTFGNGTYEVGSDVAPGKYRSPGVQEGAFALCYWDLTNDKGDIVDQGVANEGPSRATLKDGLTFKSSGCETWTIQG
jgi:hypothetical protein